MKLVLATNNMGKVREFARILEPLGISLLTQQQAGVQVQPEENGTTFAENARIKAMAVYQATGLPTIADDSGLCIDALDGQPGSTLPATTARIPVHRKNRYILSQLEGLPQEKRTARFVAHITCVLSPEQILDCEGVCESTIGLAPAGRRIWLRPHLLCKWTKALPSWTERQRMRSATAARRLQSCMNNSRNFRKIRTGKEYTIC